MKKILLAFIAVNLVISPLGAFAQEFDLPPQGTQIFDNDNNDYGTQVFTDSTFVIPQTGTQIFNNDTNCTWCSSPVIGNTGNNYGTTVYTDSTFVMPPLGSAIYNYDTNCTWCNSTQQQTTYTPVQTTYTPVSTTYGNYGVTGGSYLSIGSTGSYGTYYNPPIIAQTGSGIINNQVIQNPAPTQQCSYTQDAYTSSYTNNYPTCSKVCTNGTTVAGNQTCPAPNTPTPTQQCNYTQDAYTASYTNNYPTCSKVCTSGTTVAGSATCLAPFVISPQPTPTPIQQCSYTQDSYTASYTNNYPTCSKVCTNGLTVAGNTTCTAPNPIYNPTPTYVCSNGQTVTYLSQCPTVVNPVTYPTPIINYTPTYYQPAVVAQQPVYRAPDVIKFNNVVTSVPTQITQTSARCNGIGLIANGAPSTAWFEYGETGNLGRVTATASIGSNETAPFANVLASLKPHTTYYCRAVMQNQYGTVKGEIVRFTTKDTAVRYVAPAPVAKKTVTKTVTKQVETSRIVTCSDGSSFTVGSNTTARTINEGQKLMTLTVEKTEGDLVATKQVGYRLVYKNMSDTPLTNVNIKVTIPAEIAITNISAGSYDNDTHQLTLMVGNIAPYQEGTVSWTGKVLNGVLEGRSLVTTAYLMYSLVTTNGQLISDEVTAYVVGNVMSSYATTGEKHVIGAGDSRGFLPQSLVEWLALIAILFIIFILGRSIASAYNKDKDAHH